MRAVRLLSVALLTLLAGCASAPPPSEDAAPAAAAPAPVGPEVDPFLREACAAGDWAKAQNLCRERLAVRRKPLDQIDCGSQLAIVCWNAGERLSAVIAMDAVVASAVLCGDECGRLARTFRNAFRAGAVPEKFTPEEVTERVGIRRALLDAAERFAAGDAKKQSL